MDVKSTLLNLIFEIFLCRVSTFCSFIFPPTVYLFSSNKIAISSIYFRDIDHDNKKAEYGIFIGEADAAGRGIGSETARLAADYARDVLKLHKLMLRVFADNVGAVKSYQNAGFVQIFTSIWI